MTTELTTELLLNGELSDNEIAERAELEKGVDDAILSIRATCRMGDRLLKILHDKKLYRNTHKTWDAYCKERFGFTKGQANRRISFANLIENLEEVAINQSLTDGSSKQGDLVPVGIILPDREGQARPLLKLETPEQQHQAWKRAQEATGAEQPPATAVAKAVKEIEQGEAIEAEPAPEPEPKPEDKLAAINEKLDFYKTEYLKYQGKYQDESGSRQLAEQAEKTAKRDLKRVMAALEERNALIKEKDEELSKKAEELSKVSEIIAPELPTFESYNRRALIENAIVEFNTLTDRIASIYDETWNEEDIKLLTDLHNTLIQNAGHIAVLLESIK